MKTIMTLMAFAFCLTMNAQQDSTIILEVPINEAINSENFAKYTRSQHSHLYEDVAEMKFTRRGKAFLLSEADTNVVWKPAFDVCSTCFELKHRKYFIKFWDKEIPVMDSLGNVIDYKFKSGFEIVARPKRK